MEQNKVTPFRMEYSDITGDNNSALFLAQLEYWQGIKGNDWVVKSVTDWWNELRLTPKQVKRIKAELESFGYIETTLVYFKGSLTTGYCFKKDAVQKALSNGFNAYSTEPKGTSTKSTDTKGTSTLGTTPQEPKVLLHDNLRDYSITENTTENTTDTSSTEINSVPPDLFKSDKLKELAEQAISKNEQAKPKSKKQKEPTDELTAEIHKYVCESHDYLKKWHEAKYESPMLTYDKDFKNLKDTFRKLIEGSVNFEEAKRITAQKCFNGVKYFVDNFDKLDSFDQKKFSLNHIATNWKALKESIQKYKAPVTKPNTFEPPPVVSVKLPSIYNGVPLPIGIEVGQFRELSKEVYRDKVMEGIINDANTSLTDFMQAYQYELRKLSPEQLKELLNDYGII
jgi:hypothetical protein